MSKLLVCPWRSQTTRTLAAGLNARLAKPRLTSNKAVRADLIINWGTSSPLFMLHNARLLNNPDAVGVACSKLNTLRLLNQQKVPCLSFSTERNDALSWLVDGSSVVCRDVLNGKSGEGIRIIKRFEWHRAGRPDPDFGRARLFTRYFPKKREVRVHVGGGEVLAVAEKLKRLGQAGDNWVRSHSRGWIFAEARPELGEAPEVARSAVKALGLDFGAVDIGLDNDNHAVVIEVNTAPGLEGRTLDSYLRYFNNVV